ncbi:tail fiber protein [Gammaproteobacteria bacterium AB-CW1]|uniref:Tail fiber protein n=1 Tax=Natronospira elongata TaxID=3110268 RepID=A0AAP6JFH9_9GAMM|nr:tail fiber protein [Gammaproteobacteria bacterium AB-CW1]
MDQFLGEIRIFGGNFAPRGWAVCDGRVLPIKDYDALFMLIGTEYGGDGEETFALPDLRGRLPLHRSQSLPQGHSGGDETVSLSRQQLPEHSHTLRAGSDNADKGAPGSNVLGRDASVNLYANLGQPDVGMSDSSIGHTGGGQPHENMMPFLCVNFIIALTGVWPSED